MSEYKVYKRLGTAEMRPVLASETFYGLEECVSISHKDITDGSPKMGDMIARNPKSHKDKWLVAKKYFDDNFEEADE